MAANPNPKSALTTFLILNLIRRRHRLTPYDRPDDESDSDESGASVVEIQGSPNRQSDMHDLNPDESFSPTHQNNYTEYRKYNYITFNLN